MYTNIPKCIPLYPHMTLETILRPLQNLKILYVMTLGTQSLLDGCIDTQGNTFL